MFPAGTEASGTGNMKLMLNGAITLGTLDGANVEIHDAVGDENIFIFGMKTPDVENLKRAGYNPQNYLNNNETLRNAVDFIRNGVNGKRFDEIVSSLTNSDPYMALADFADYQKAQKAVSKAYADRENFAKMSLMNISGAGISRPIVRLWIMPIIFGTQSLFNSRRSLRKHLKNQPLWLRRQQKKHLLKELPKNQNN